MSTVREAAAQIVCEVEEYAERGEHHNAIDVVERSLFKLLNFPIAWRGRAPEYEEIKPGMVLRVRGADDLYLVGDVNDCRGVCDDCTTFAHDEIEDFAALPIGLVQREDGSWCMRVSP